jgi:hypothetical protein
LPASIDGLIIRDDAIPMFGGVERQLVVRSNAFPATNLARKSLLF